MASFPEDEWIVKKNALIIAVACLFVAGCVLPGMRPPTVETANSVGLENVQLVALSAKTAGLSHVQQSTKYPPSYLWESMAAIPEYRIGAHDVLDIVVWGRPELNNPGGMTQTPESRGRKVRADGTIFFPFVGVQNVAGKTVEDVRKALRTGLAGFIKKPQVDVRVAAHYAHKFYVTGEVVSPGIQYIQSQPTTLIDAIRLAGGKTEAADLTNVVLTRNSQRHVIDLENLFIQGGTGIWVREGDIINVRDNSNNKVFVLGEVEIQAIVPMHKGRLTLAEALAGSQSINLQHANARGVYVLRQQEAGIQASQTQVFQLDASSPDAILVADMFELRPRDVVFVSTASLSRWNRVVRQILPTVQTIFQTDTLIQRR